PAGLTMARTVGLMRASAKLLAAGGTPPDPAEILRRANDDLAAANEEQTFVTAVVLVLDALTGTGRMALAGHESPLRLGPGGVGVVDPKRRQPPLGIMEDFAYASEPVAMQAGEALLLFSDGVTEAEDGQGGFLGRDRLVECLAPVAGATPEAIIAAVLARIAAFAGDAPQADDITALAFRFQG
ncbi:MAG: serine/threonine-protein phosphatase, partial [Acetobacteraceae bacterium]